MKIPLKGSIKVMMMMRFNKKLFEGEFSLSSQTLYILVLGPLTNDSNYLDTFICVDNSLKVLNEITKSSLAVQVFSVF